ncbi:class I SAM-dependent methyltransferase [Phenylobacterium sp.]|uniref:class I SAM-dependent methyltransferase n=1 Tax=Phenylobacterium sp. TaxID=1871053 RepID=UPI002B56B920|nr:methyltransferase domain-containing protein [Phenylobacterium sp.]HVI33228.1 methyltransferase domain-containing protein [Phenylobacterium sp.]
MTRATDPKLAPKLTKYARLDAFLERLRGDVYPEPPSPLHSQITAQMFQRLQALHPLPPGARVLDVGCGQGAALELFRDAGLDATGISVGEDVAACRAKGLNAVEMDFGFLDFADEAFDLVWCRHALEHSLMPYFMLAELFRVLTPGGVLYVEVPAPDTACRHQANPNHYSVLPKSMWAELIRRAGFADLKVNDLALTTAAGPDVYWAFVARRPSAAPAGPA